jgi:hypothetical protein
MAMKSRRMRWVGRAARKGEKKGPLGIGGVIGQIFSWIFEN